MCEVCNIVLHRPTYAKNTRTKKKHLENEIIPDWLLEDLIENKKIYRCTPKPLREIARDNIKFDHKQVSKELPKATINPLYFTDRE